MTGKYSQEAIDRFWRKVSRGEPEECWAWTGARTVKGYGNLRIDKVYLRAHRVSYEIHHGVRLERQQVCHRCDNPPCVNPAHLFLGDHAINGQDMAAKGRAKNQVPPELRVQIVREYEALTRTNHGRVRGYRTIGEKFGLFHNTVGRIIREERRKNG
jgi:hypothetical protein